MRSVRRIGLVAMISAVLVALGLVSPPSIGQPGQDPEPVVVLRHATHVTLEVPCWLDTNPCTRTVLFDRLIRIDVSSRTIDPVTNELSAKRWGSVRIALPMADHSFVTFRQKLESELAGRSVDEIDAFFSNVTREPHSMLTVPTLDHVIFHSGELTGTAWTCATLGRRNPVKVGLRGDIAGPPGSSERPTLRYFQDAPPLCEAMDAALSKVAGELIWPRPERHGRRRGRSRRV